MHELLLTLVAFSLISKGRPRLGVSILGLIAVEKASAAEDQSERMLRTAVDRLYVEATTISDS